MQAKKFHHGNLRAELLELATKRIEEVGIEALSLRELANTLGVSVAAPYRHFASRDDLLRAMAEREVARLAQAYHDAACAPISPRARFRLACRRYLELAMHRPHAFRMVFLAQSYLGTPETSDAQVAYDLFVDLAMAAFDLTERHAAEVMALNAWATLHGFAIIRMDSRMPLLAQSPEMVEAVLDHASQGHLAIQAK